MDYKEHRKIVICYNPPKQESNQIETNEFLAWAKSDIKAGDKRGRGNALCNIKKAIHSRIDEIIASTHLVFARDWSCSTRGRSCRTCFTNAISARMSPNIIDIQKHLIKPQCIDVRFP